MATGEKSVPSLFDLLASDSCSLDRICAAVRAGADVNAVDDSGHSVLMCAIDRDCREDCIHVARLLVELGANIRYEAPNGDNVLTSTLYRHDFKLIECLLQWGADPNAVLDRSDTPLDIAEMYLESQERWGMWDWDEKKFHQTCETQKAIIALLKAAGGKNFDDMVAEYPRKWISIFANYDTGITTRDGRLVCEKLPNVTPEFCQQFRQWLTNHFDTWRDKSFDEMPAGFDRVAHNDEGRRLALQVRRAVGNEITVEYAHICPEWEAKRIRDVVTETL